MQNNNRLILYKRTSIDTPWHFVFSKNHHNECPKLENTIHWHDYHEFEIVISGNAMHLLNNEAIPIHKGSAYLLTPFDFHTTHPLNGEYATSYCFNFDSLALNEEIFQIITQSNKMLYLDLSDSEFNSVIEDIHLLESEQNKPDTPVKTLLFSTTFSKIILTFLHALTSTNIIQLSKAPTGAFQQAIAYTNQHFREQLTLNKLANIVGLTPNYLGLLFKKQYNKSYNQFIMDLRLCYAKNLLKHTDYSIAEIAKKSGFNATSYFIKCFSKAYNISPKAYTLIGKSSLSSQNDN